MRMEKGLMKETVEEERRGISSSLLLHRFIRNPLLNPSSCSSVPYVRPSQNLHNVILYSWLRSTRFMPSSSALWANVQNKPRWHAPLLKKSQYLYMVGLDSTAFLGGIVEQLWSRLKNTCK